MQQRENADRQTRIADYRDQQQQLEQSFKVINDQINWKATVVYAVLSELIDALENMCVCTLMDICATV